MNNHTVLFITNEIVTSTDGTIYDYNNCIYDNRNNDETFIRWSGQKKIR